MWMLHSWMHSAVYQPPEYRSPLFKISEWRIVEGGFLFTEGERIICKGLTYTQGSAIGKSPASHRITTSWTRASQYVCWQTSKVSHSIRTVILIYRKLFVWGIVPHIPIGQGNCWASFYNKNWWSLGHKQDWFYTYKWKCLFIYLLKVCNLPQNPKQWDLLYHYNTKQRNEVDDIQHDKSMWL